MKRVSGILCKLGVKIAGPRDVVDSRSEAGEVRMEGGQMSHSVCGECSELEYRTAGGSDTCVGGDMIGHGSRALPAP